MTFSTAGFMPLTWLDGLDGASASYLRASSWRLEAGNAFELGQSIANGPGLADRAVPGTVLTRREAQVVVLVASGRTNRQIGTALGIAEKTAEVHIQHVMAKVGAHNRAEVAAWAVRQGLASQ